MKIPRSARARAHEGAQLLTLIDPTWHEKVDPDRLDIDDHIDCVLGQMYGTYAHGVVALCISYDRAIELGFMSAGWEIATDWLDAELLTRAWRKIIKRRQRSNISELRAELYALQAELDQLRPSLRGYELTDCWTDEITDWKDQHEHVPT